MFTLITPCKLKNGACGFTPGNFIVADAPVPPTFHAARKTVLNPSPPVNAPNVPILRLYCNAYHLLDTACFCCNAGNCTFRYPIEDGVLEESPAMIPVNCNGKLLTRLPVLR